MPSHQSPAVTAERFQDYSRKLYECPHCNHRVAKVVSSGVVVTQAVFETQDYCDQLEDALPEAQRRTPHALEVHAGTCDKCGGGYAMLVVTLATDDKALAPAEADDMGAKTYCITPAPALALTERFRRWAMFKDQRVGTQKHTHWLGLFKLRVPLDGKSLSGANVPACLEEGEYAAMTEVLAKTWTHLVALLPAYTKVNTRADKALLARQARQILDQEGEGLLTAFIMLNEDYDRLEALKALTWDANQNPERFMTQLPSLREIASEPEDI